MKKFEIRIKPTNILEGEDNIQFQSEIVTEFQPEDTSVPGFISYYFLYIACKVLM